MLSPLDHTIDHHNTARRYAYSTDLVPWFPGKTADGRHDVAPTDEEIRECWHWIEREMELISPRAIVLLGRPAARSFLNNYTSTRVGRSKPSLSELAGTPFAARVGVRNVIVVVAWHPSSAWGAFVDAARASYSQAQAVLKPLLADSAQPGS